MASIFLSYAHGDEARVDAVRRALSAAQFEVVYDAHIPAGTSWRDWLKEHVEQASVLIVLWSRRSAQRNWVRAEADVAQRSSVLIPIIIDDLTPDEVPFGFGEVQALLCQWDAHGELSRESTERLIQAVRAKINTIDPLQTAIQQLRTELLATYANKYEVLRTIGAGRLSVVFHARDLVERALEVAIKVTPLTGILLQPELYERFRQGVFAAKQLHHRNMLRIDDLRLEKGFACVVMEYVDGLPLSHLISGTSLPLSRVKHFALQLADALAHAHESDVIHCNLRSSNILVDKNERVVITDFGLSRVRGRMGHAGTPTEFFWNPTYVSPEQCRGEHSSTRSDQYSLGVILYELLTGVPPFQGKSAYELMRKHCEEAPPRVRELRPDCPAAIDATVMRLLDKRTSERFLTTRQLLSEIQTWPAYAVGCGTSDDVCNLGQIACQCYERCIAQRPQLIQELYLRLTRHDELRGHLERLNFDVQVAVLQRGIPQLLSFDPESAPHAAYMQMLVRAHQPLGLARRHFDIFRDTLVQLVTETSLLLSSDVQGGTAQFERALDAALTRLAEALERPASVAQ
jgi:serine/threonine protein kinase